MPRRWAAVWLAFAGLVLLPAGCADVSPFSPVIPRRVAFSGKVFANGGSVYTANVLNTQRSPVQLEYRRAGDAAFQVARDFQIPMTDSSYGTMQVRVLENGEEVKSNQTVEIYKGELATDTELGVYLSSIANLTSSDPRKIMWFQLNLALDDGSGVIFDAYCDRADCGVGTTRGFYIVRIANEDEDSHRDKYIFGAPLIMTGPPVCMPSPGHVDVLFIEPGEDQATKIQTYLSKF